MSLFSELKRRNVIRIATAYVVVSWLVIQVADAVLDMVGAPDWVGKALLALLAIGLVPALVIAWLFEVTPEGIRRDEGSETSGAGTRGQRLNVLTIAAVTLLAAMFAWQQLSGPKLPSDIAASEGDYAAMISAEDKSIAVLPFIALSADENDAYFGKGVAEELLNALARFPELKVAARTSAFSFEGKDVDLREVGRALGVAHILEGSTRSSGARVRVTAQLIRASDGFHLWSETFDRDMSDIFAVQDEIVREISRMLQIRLGVGAGSGRSTSSHVEPQAYQNYLRGLDLLGARADDKKRAGAIKALELATTQDPDFADGWAAYGVALAVSEPKYSGMTYVQHIAEARKALEMALVLEPQNARALAGLAIDVLQVELDVVRGTALAAEAVGIAPNASLSNYAQAFSLNIRGEYAKAMQAMERAIALDPLNEVLRRVRTEYLSSRGDYAAVSDNSEQCATCSPTETLIIARARYMAARRGGSDDDVRETAAVVYALASEILQNDRSSFDGVANFPGPKVLLGTTEPQFVEWYLGGPRPDAVQLAWMSDIDLDSAHVGEAPMFASLGETDIALSVLFAAFRSYKDNLFMGLDAMGRDAWPDSFRRDPRFHEFWARPNMPELAAILRENGRTSALPLPAMEDE